MTSTILISPTEPDQIKSIGVVSSAPELYGADILISGDFGLCGIQRKEVKDFVNSVYYGDRMALEVGKMGQLDIGIWMIEGKWNWNRDGVSVTVPTFTKVEWDGLMFSLNYRGFWTIHTETKQDSIASVLRLMKWLEKEDHRGLTQRKNPDPQWGRVTNRAWSTYFLQGFPSIGPKMAEQIYDHFQGIPLQWTCDIVDLMEVDGVGIKTAQMLMEAFDGS